MADEPYDPSQHTVDEVQEYLATADDAERDRVLAAERDGKARVGILGDEAHTEQGERSSTKGMTFAQAAEAATPDERGYTGTSPEAERTGRRDKGLSQRNPAIMQGGPIPDPRPSVDDSEALDALRQEG